MYMQVFQNIKKKFDIQSASGSTVSDTGCPTCNDDGIDKTAMVSSLRSEREGKLNFFYADFNIAVPKMLEGSAFCTVFSVVLLCYTSS